MDWNFFFFFKQDTMVSNANTGRKISICEKIRENIGKKSFMERLFCDFILDDVIIFLKTPV